MSRWDVAVAKQVPADLADKLALAVGLDIYRAYRRLMSSDRFQRLENDGARMQRLLWASTKTKDPAASDTLYVHGLAAPFTVNTMPDDTLEAFFDHGEVGEPLPADGGDADALLSRFAAAGIDTGDARGQAPERWGQVLCERLERAHGPHQGADRLGRLNVRAMIAPRGDTSAKFATAGAARPTKPSQSTIAKIEGRHLRELFAEDPTRGERLSAEAVGLYLDYSKNRITDETLGLLFELAQQSGLERHRDAMFAGERINVSENRSVLHVALRMPKGASLVVDGVDVVAEVHEVLDRMAAFANRIRSGEWKGHTGKPIRNIVNIGIGGSDLVPVMAYEALRHYSAEI